MPKNFTAKLLAAFFVSAFLVWAVTTPDNSLAFKSISVEGTNLVLRAVIPAGLEKVTLETRPDLDSKWEAAGMLEVTNAGDEVEFTIPKPDGMQFMRLNATPIVTTTISNAISPELNYVTMPSLTVENKTTTNSLGKNVKPSSEAVFHFKGRVDGSDKILIRRDGALWSHVNWGWPEGNVLVNGVEWKPSEKNYVTTSGQEKFLPANFRFDSAVLEIVKARDVVALEQASEGLIVYINDTPSGADDYEFKIHFSSKVKMPPKSSSATLQIVATIDGSECLTLSSNEARWEHFHYQKPKKVMLNDFVWNPTKEPLLQNVKSSLKLPDGIDFRSAKIVKRKGRDLATLWTTDKELKIYFADNPNGADNYELTIAFGE